MGNCPGQMHFFRKTGGVPRVRWPCPQVAPAEIKVCMQNWLTICHLSSALRVWAYLWEKVVSQRSLASLSTTTPALDLGLGIRLVSKGAFLTWMSPACHQLMSNCHPVPKKCNHGSKRSRTRPIFCHHKEGIMPPMKIDCLRSTLVVHGVSLEIPCDDNRNITKLGNHLKNLMEQSVIGPQGVGAVGSARLEVNRKHQDFEGWEI